MYVTESSSGHQIEWNPEDETAAEQAMDEIVDRFDGWNGTRYELDRPVARSVVDRYNEILEAQA